ncbi:MAG: VWA domain-containing protein [Acidobacteriaceae bacterium]|nr:VWA domain-containing protein [Acidobacteriaceae bacterium]
MFFLNLTAGEFFTLLGALGGLITALYLLDRTKRKKVVSTLQFWTPALTADESQSRRRMREPWSLILQLASLLLLLLAIAQLQWGSRERRGRDHVLLVDTSSWTAEQLGGTTLLDREKAMARNYLAALPARDRVMLVRADGLTVPVTAFTSDRRQVVNGLESLHSGFTALNLDQALSFAGQAENWSGGKRGEIIYVGPHLISETDSNLPALPNLRVIDVPASRANCGIRRIGVRRSEEDVNSWQATVTLKNYGAERVTVRLKTQFAGTMFAPRIFTLSGGEEKSGEYNFVTNTAGRLIATIEPGDALASDDRVVMQLPRNGMLNVVVFTDRPEVLKPLLEANHRLSVKYLSASQYTPNAAADVMVLDRMAPQRKPAIPSLWIQPDAGASPLPVKTVVHDAAVKTWHSESALGTGLHAKEAHLPEAEVFQTFEGDLTVASLAEGPVVVARPGNQSQSKTAVIGFDPLVGELKFEVTTPLLFANLLRWLSPDSFRAVDITAGQVGAASITLDPNERADRIRIRDEKGFAVPFTVRGQNLQLFASRPSVIRVDSGDRERIISLTLPDVAESEWKPPENAAAGIPRPLAFAPASFDLWQWLALVGGAGLFLEKMLFGRDRKWKRRKLTRQTGSVTRVQPRERELISK